MLAARLQIDSQANQILSLEASLLAHPSLSTGGSIDEKDRLLAEQAQTIKELEAIANTYEEKGGSTSSATISKEERRRVREEVEKEWIAKVEEEKKKREEKERWAEEVTKALDKEKKVSSISHSFTAVFLTLDTRLDRSWRMNDGPSQHSSANSTRWA